MSPVMRRPVFSASRDTRARLPEPADLADDFADGGVRIAPHKRVDHLVLPDFCRARSQRARLRRLRQRRLRLRRE